MTAIDRKAVGERLTRLRLKRGYSSAKSAAEDMGIPKSNLYNYEKGITLPGDEHLETLCAFYGVSAKWLYFGEEEARSLPPDIALIREVIETVEEIFEEQELYLTPSKKAELILLIYEELLRDASMRADLKGRALRLIKFAS